MMHYRKTIFFHKNEPWVKQNCDENFDVPMGCLDGAEFCDLTGLYISSKIKSVFENQNNVGLYRDIGLGILRNLSGPQIEKVKKEIIKIFKECGLSTAKTILKVVQFLEIELDLIKNTYRPYEKPNDDSMYINVNSNHRTSIIKQMLNQKFQKNVIMKRENGNERLFGSILCIQKMSRLTSVRYSSCYYINIFSPSKSFQKNFNKNSVKISYSCMRSIISIISAHTCSILNPPKTNFGCNFRNRSMCPFQNKCFTPNIVYEAGIIDNVDERRVYLGLSENLLKRDIVIMLGILTVRYITTRLNFRNMCGI